MGQTAHIPAWVVPTARAVADCHWIAHACAREAGPVSRYAQVAAVMDWVTSDQPSRDEAIERMLASSGAAYDTIAWLIGRMDPPVQIPRRNPDGSVMTAEELAAEYLAGTTGLPEQRRDAEAKARKDAARYQRLAALVPH